jgi:oxygen-dependent protoporphyrinogen oxidase
MKPTVKRIAIVGGGIAGLSAAYQLEGLHAQNGTAHCACTLFEAGPRLGGIVETKRRAGFVVECGPDSWVSEKPAARALAVELGLEAALLGSNDLWRKTYLAEGRTLTPLPDGMRMMVPSNWAALLASPLLSWQAKLAYLREPKRAAELQASALENSNDGRDESVYDFVCRHFGAEATEAFAAPLLAGVFGGDIHTLSARAVLPIFTRIEREDGSLILGLQARLRAASNNRFGTSVPIFTSLRDGLGTLIERMEQRIPAASIRRDTAVRALERAGERWRVRTECNGVQSEELFDAVILAVPAHVAAALLAPLDATMPALLPQQASSAIVVALAFTPASAASMRIPRGFGFLVPQKKPALAGSTQDAREALARRALLACTFVDQKFPHRAPPGAVLLRAFFGGPLAPALLAEPDATLAGLAQQALATTLGKLPEPEFTVVRRWPQSLPLYAVGHLQRLEELQRRVALLPGLHLIGNAYHGVGLPDLIAAGRAAADAAIGAACGQSKTGNPPAAQTHPQQ